ncbi:MAG: putative iron-sulfur cluster-binding metallochaperone [Thermoanaerobaculia bacterium]
MSSCCTNTPGSCELKPATVASDVCERCGRQGQPVDPITLKALLTPDALRRGVPASPRFCRTEDCPVVYFDNAASRTFSEEDLIVPVHAKHPHDEDVPVCCCFAHSPGTIRREIERKGSSTASEIIAAEVKAGHCACEVRNPKGNCCLGDVAKAEMEMKTWLQEKEQPSAKST